MMPSTRRRLLRFYAAYPKEERSRMLAEWQDLADKLLDEKLTDPLEATKFLIDDPYAVAIGGGLALFLKHPPSWFYMVLVHRHLVREAGRISRGDPPD